MSYTPAIDFLALLRQTGNGMRTERMPGLDYVVPALARAGLIILSVGQTAPVANQATTAWFKPAVPSWAAEGTLFLWDPVALAYSPATPLLWSLFLTLTAASVQITQDVTSPGPANVLTNAGVVRVNQLVSAPITLVMPLSSTKIGSVLITDWKGDAGANNITIQRTAPDVFPGALTSWTIGADTGSVFLRPVAGGYAL